MDTFFELWDVETANLLGSYAAEAEALRFAPEMAAEHDAEALATWALTRASQQGETLTLADGRGILIRSAGSQRTLLNRLGATDG